MTVESSVLHLSGNVAAFCGVCKRDVIVCEDARRCPYGDHDVEPTSLPKVPRQRPVPQQAVTAPDSPAPAPQSVTLPRMRQAASWGKATDDLLMALEREEAEAVAAFEVARERAKAARRAANAMRQIRGLVKLDGSPAPGRAPKQPKRPKPEGRWSRDHDRCINCGTTRVMHGSKGRCSSCQTYFRNHGADRVVSESAS